jgi:hypothetical protein
VSFFILVLLVMITSLFEIVIGYVGLISFKKQDYVTTLFSVIVFLVCLIGFGDLFIQLMIDDAIILQVDATVIAGLLILLSIASIWSKKQTDVLESKTVKNWGVYYSPRQVFFTVIPFSISAIATLASSLDIPFTQYLSVTMCGAGFLIILIIGLVISSKDSIIKSKKNTSGESADS